MNQTCNVVPLFGEHGLDQGNVATSWAEQGLADGEIGIGQWIAHLVGAAVDELIGGLGIAAFRIFLFVNGSKQVMASAG